ncbi:MAG TPA: response regulator [Gammaproteobacteria bacterium]|nr:response regulator [Gammaproteobacteria bacterium]
MPASPPDFLADRRPERPRVLGWLVALLLVAPLALSAWYAHRVQDIGKRELAEARLLLARHLAASLERSLGDAFLALDAVAQRPTLLDALAAGDIPRLGEVLDDAARPLWAFGELAIFDTEHRLLAHWPPGGDAAATPAVLRDGTRARASHGAGDPAVITHAAPLRDGGGELRGTLVGAISFAKLLDAQHLPSFGITGAVTVVDSSANVLASSEPARRGTRLQAQPLRTLAESRTMGTALYYSATLQREEFAAIAPLSGYPLSVIVSQGAAETFTALAPFRRMLLASGGAMALLVMIAGLLGTRLLFRYETALRQAFALHETILQSADLGVITVDRKGIIRTFNRTAERWLGYEAHEMIGRKSVLDLVAASELALLTAHTARRTGKPESALEYEDYIPEVVAGGIRHVERLFQRRDGSPLPVQISVTTLHDAHGTITGYAGVFFDLTERKRVERLKDEFVATVSHELRTPLTSIRGALGLVMGGAAGELPGQARALLRIAHANSERLVRLINDILDIEKIEAGRLEFRFERLELAGLVEQAVLANMGYAQEHRVTLAFRDRPARIYVDGDRDRLMQVMSNLLSNACKFAPPCDLVEVVMRIEGDAVRVSVTDHGSGIPESFRPHVFERFRQAAGGDSRRKGGTGLGLWICKAIVEKHGGRIGFDSRHGETTFWFELPCREDEQPSAPRIDRRARVLVCEDDPDVAQILASILEANGIAADVAHDAATAARLLAERHHDALIADILLPDKDGIELLHELRADPRTQDIPAVIVSAIAEARRPEVNGGLLPVADWLTKPVDPDRLVAAVRRTLRQRQRSAMRPHVLHVEDDADLAALVRVLLGSFADVESGGTLATARQALAHHHYDLVIVDLNLPDGSGYDLIAELNGRVPPLPVVIFSAYEVHGEVARNVAAVLSKSKLSEEEFVRIVRECLGLATAPEVAP